MAASVPAAGACGHRSVAPISSLATQPPCRLLLHSLNQAAASECSSSKGEGRGKEGRGGARGEAGGGRGGRERAACWHPKEEHVCSWPAA